MKMECQQDCPICLCPLTKRQKTHTTECNHTFHIKCFERIKSLSCPCCRATVEAIPKQKLTVLKEEILFHKADQRKIQKELTTIIRDSNEIIRHNQERKRELKRSFPEYKKSLDEMMADQLRRVNVLFEQKNIKKEPDIVLDNELKKEQGYLKTCRILIYESIKQYHKELDSYNMKIAVENTYKKDNKNRFQYYKTEIANRIQQIEKEIQQIKTVVA